MVKTFPLKEINVRNKILAQFSRLSLFYFGGDFFFVWWIWETNGFPNWYDFFLLCARTLIHRELSDDKWNAEMSYWVSVAPRLCLSMLIDNGCHGNMWRDKKSHKCISKFSFFTQYIRANQFMVWTPAFIVFPWVGMHCLI